MDELQQRRLVFLRDGQFAVEALQCVTDERHVGLEVDGFDGQSRSKKFQILLVKISGINELGRGEPGADLAKILETSNLPAKYYNQTT